MVCFLCKGWRSDVYAREREYRAAKDRKESTTELTLALQAARDAERATVHDCALLRFAGEAIAGDLERTILYHQMD